MAPDKVEELECIVAAMLATSTPSIAPKLPEAMVLRYRHILAELRKNGGVLSDKA